MQQMICNAAKTVARVLGCGHSERVYQKALSIELQKRVMDMESSAPTVHSLEYHIPVLYDNMSVGSERIDIVVRDSEQRAYLVELKATEASLRRGRGRTSPESGEALPAAHVQLLKYLRMMWTCDHVCEGYVINFRQRLLHGAAPLMAPCELEVDRFDVTTQQWHFGVVDTQDTSDTRDTQDTRDTPDTPMRKEGVSVARSLVSSAGIDVGRDGSSHPRADICVDTGISIGL